MRPIFLLVFLGCTVFAIMPGRPTGNVPPVMCQLELRTVDDFRCNWDDTRGVARWVFPDEPIYFPTSPQQTVSAALNFVDAHREVFGLSSAELVPKMPIRRMGRVWLNIQQYHIGKPVIDGSVYFRILHDGQVWAFGSRAITKFSPADGIPAISARDAMLAAAEQLEYAINAHDNDEYALVWFPVNGIGRLAYQVIVSGSAPDRFKCWIDAQNGKLLGWTNMVNYYDLSGDVGISYLPDFFDDPYDSAAFANGRISFNYVQQTTTNDSGHYYLDAWIGGVYQPLRSWLKGLWVDVQRLDDGSDAMILRYIAPPAVFNWQWSDDAAIPDELNLYFHTNYIHNYYKTLDPDMTGLDYPVPARARIPDTPGNAYWDGYGTNYGAGDESSRNFALFANVIYHEYTHGVTGWIYRDAYFPYADEPGALNEAFSDYFACTNTDYPYAGYRVPTDDTYIRTLDNDFFYPDDWFGEPHYDSRMISGAFWEIREGVYPDRIGWADSLIHFTRYSEANTFDDFAVECFFTADDDADLSNGCNHFGLIANSFARHGIGPGFYPEFWIGDFNITDLGDGDGIFEPGEQFQISAAVVYCHRSTRIPDFPFPSIEDAFSFVYSYDEAFVFLDEYSDIGEMEHGDSVVVTFLGQIADSVIPHYGSICLSVSASTGEGDALTWNKVQTMEVGSPQVLLVDGGADPELQLYYTSALEQIPAVFNVVEATDSTPTTSQMMQYPVVIWFTGNARNSLSDDNMSAIGDYITGGGNVVLTGKDGFDAPSYSEWLNLYFGAHIETDSVPALSVDGVFGDELGDGFNLIIFGSVGANNQQSPSVLAADEGTIFQRYSLLGNPPAGVRYDGSILLGFGLEACYSSGINLSLAEALRRFMEWFGVEIYSPARQQMQKPVSLVVSAYPNPFNSAIKFEIKNAQRGFYIEIFNLNGKRVFSADEDGNRKVIWRPQGIPTGVYLYRVKASGDENSGKIIYIR